MILFLYSVLFGVAALVVVVVGTEYPRSARGPPPHGANRAPTHLPQVIGAWRAGPGARAEPPLVEPAKLRDLGTLRCSGPTR